MSFHSILFLDIETVPQQPGYDQLPAEWKELWDKKSATLLRHQEEESASSLYARAGIYAEF
ncbi:MAG: 3'-5' exonuclease, partial [Chitinophagaceae bacterium]